MIKSIICSLLISCFFTHTAASQVHRINTNTTQHIYQIEKTDSIFLLKGPFFLGKCYGGCDTVIQFNLPDYFTGRLKVVDSSQYFLLATLSGGPQYHQRIYKTSDGGLSWNVLLDTIYFPINDISIFDSLEGLAFSTKKNAVRTTDGGMTWKPITYPENVVQNMHTYGDSTICTAILDDFIISKDRGHNWERNSFTAMNSPAKKFFFLNKDTIFAITYNELFLHSFNGGKNWKSLWFEDWSGSINTVPIDLDPHALFAKNSNELYFVGVNDDSEGIIVKTVDLFETWQVFNTKIKSVLTDINFLNDSTALISGSGGLLFKWNTNDTNFANVSTPEAFSSKTTVSISPNPVSNNQTVVLQLQKTAIVEIQLFDIQGRLVRSIYKGKIPQGETKFFVDVSCLPTGSYIYKTDVDGQPSFRKMIKID